MIHSAGFTLIELLIVIALIAIIGGMTSPFLSRFVLDTNLNSTEEKIVSSLRKAQSYAMAHKDGKTWGVCKTGNTIKMYSVSCSTPDTLDTYVIPSTITVSGITDITFNNRGEPSSASVITVQSGTKSKDITIARAGAIQYALSATSTPAPTATPTPTIPGPTNTPIPTNTPVPTATTAPTSTPVPTQTPTSPPVPTATATPTSTPTPTPTPTPNPLSASIVSTSDWVAGFCTEITITNSSAAPVNGWTLTVSRDGYTNYTSWNANFATNGSTYTLTPVGWNTTIPASSSITSIGFCAIKGIGFIFPSVVSIL